MLENNFQEPATPQTPSRKHLHRSLRYGQQVLLFAFRLSAIGLLATAPGAPLLLAPIWQRLRGDKDFFKKAEQLDPLVQASCTITADHPRYGHLRRKLDNILQSKPGTAPVTLVVLPELWLTPSKTDGLNRVIMLNETYLRAMNPQERETLLVHEFDHVDGKASRLARMAAMFRHNAQAICKWAMLPLAGTYATASLLAPQMLTAAEAQLTRLTPLTPPTPEMLLFNTLVTLGIAYPVMNIISGFASREAELAADRKSVRHMGLDSFTHIMLRLDTLPDPDCRAVLAMRDVLQEPRRTWRERLHWRTLAMSHPDFRARIRAAYRYAAHKGIKPSIPPDGHWRARSGTQTHRL